jgi:superkiller protein 3
MFIGAVTEYRNALQLEPKNDRAAIALSKLLYDQGLYEEAFDVRRQLLRVRPEMLRARLDLAYLLQLQARYKETEEETRAVLKNLDAMKAPANDPIRVYALHLAGRNSLGQRRYDEGERQLLEVVKLDPNFVEAHLNLAEMYSQKEESYEKAVYYFRKALELKPNLPVALRQLGKTLLNLGRTQQAKEYLQRAVQLDPNQSEPYFLLAAAYRKEGDVEKTQEMLSRFQRLDGDRQIAERNLLKARSLCIEGEEHLSNHDLNKALRAFREAQELAPGSHEAFFGLAKVHLDRNEPQEALQKIEKALELQPFYAMYHYVQAVCFDELKGTPDALRAIRKAITLNPALPQFHNLLGNLLTKKEEYQQAIQAYRRAIELDAVDPSYHLNLSHALAKAGSLEESEKERKYYQKLVARP